MTASSATGNLDEPATSVRTDEAPITVVIHSRSRPLYLWASLDSLFRHTKFPHQFVLVDLGSEDPLVRQVVSGFERRGMFFEVVWLPRNSWSDFRGFLEQVLTGNGDFAAYVESDVIVPEMDPCWLSTFVGLMRANPRLAMLGSVIDRRDFVDLGRAVELSPEKPVGELHDLIKWSSPERVQNPAEAGESPIFRPHNPAGRLLMVRRDAVREAGLWEDGRLDHMLRERGYETGIATQVRHRHLSLLHIYDYPDYDYGERVLRVWTSFRRTMTDVRTGRGTAFFSLSAAGV